MTKKVKILYIDQGVAFGGAIVVAANLIRSLDREKFDAVFIGAMEPEIMQHHIRDAAPVHYITQNFNYTHLEKMVAVFNKISTGQFKRALMYAAYCLRLIINLPYMWKILRVIRREKPDLVHMNNGIGNDEADLIAKLMGIPRVIHLHGYASFSGIQRKLIKDVPGYIAISEFVKTEMEKHGIAPQKMKVIPNPAFPDPVSGAEITALRAHYQIGNDQLLFGIFGRLVDWKGQHEFILAAAQVLKKIPQAKAFIVGDISDGEESYLDGLKSLAEEEGVADRIIFTGYIKDVRCHYKMMDLAVHCSTTGEPFGLVITEAMSYGVPVIAANFGAPIEIIEEGVDGYLVDPKDTEKLSSTIIQVLQDPELRTKLAAAAQQKADQVYNAEKYARNVEAYYLTCLQRF